jgi:hypothetical protein
MHSLFGEVIECMTEVEKALGESTEFAASVTTENFVRISTGSIWDDDRDCVGRVAIIPTDHTGLEGVGVSDPPS